MTRFPNPEGGSGRVRDRNPDGEGEDDFTFYLDRAGFLRLILDDLALPDLLKKSLTYSLVE